MTRLSTLSLRASRGATVAAALLLATLGCGGSTTAPADEPSPDPGPAPADTVVTRAVLPASTGPNVRATIGDHYVAVPRRAGRRGRLLVFFPGTGGRPDQYAGFIRRAAELGDHALGLAYENAQSVNFALCPGQPPACHEQVRLEILTGVESGWTPPAVDVDNAAFTRLVLLLRYLDATYPGEGWDAYLTAAGAPRWEAIAVAGHSQGGGHAAMTAKLHRVERAILFGATEPQPWTSAPFATPATRLFGFAHADEINFTAISRSWGNLGMPGLPVVVDALAAPFTGSHRLVTQDTACRGDAADRGLHHNCPVVETYYPLLADGETSAFRPVWDYLLTAPVR